MVRFMSTILRSKQIRYSRPIDARPPKFGGLSVVEQTHVRKALRFLCDQAGSPAMAAEALETTVQALWKVRSPHRAPSMKLARAVARAVGVHVDDVLTGAWPRACPACGQSCA